jgi:hypothetical protein
VKLDTHPERLNTASGSDESSHPTARDCTCDVLGESRDAHLSKCSIVTPYSVLGIRTLRTGSP